MTQVMYQVDKDDPLMLAWKTYKASYEYKNTKRWIDGRYQYGESALWAAFEKGWVESEKASSVAIDKATQMLRVTNDVFDRFKGFEETVRRYITSDSPVIIEQAYEELCKFFNVAPDTDPEEDLET